MPQVPDPACRPADLHLAFLVSPVTVRDNLARMLTMPPLSDLPKEARGVAELVLAEVLNNVAEHAYANETGLVTVTLRRVAGGVACHIVDQGAAMPNGKLPDGKLPAIHLPSGPDQALDTLPEGGFGWHLIRSLTEDLTYSYAGGANRLCFLLPVPELSLTDKPGSQISQATRD
ncbi:MAG: ATP-binding protein [Rhodobacterales bacterium]|nr:ATP-binding protein [Rhodobacterales bacterium]